VSTQVRDRVVRVRARSVRAARLPFGLSAPEIVVAFIAIALLAVVVTYYFSSIKPERDRLHVLELEFAEQQRNIVASATPPSKNQASPADMARDAIESLETFKTGHLKPFSSGRIDLIKEINALAKKHSVVLTSGIEMGASMGGSNAEADKANGKGDKKSSVTRKKSEEIFNAFPSVSFRFTVFGQYPQVRAFINDLEREKQFIVINSINLTNQEARTSRRSRGGEGGGVAGIMLTIDMFAYFQPM
jgi:hypothetical protein